MRGWQKAQLTEELEIMDEMIENPDNEEEMLLQDAMGELILEDDEQNDDDDDVELVHALLVGEEELIPEEPERNTTKNKAKLLFYLLNKNKFQININFLQPISRVSKILKSVPCIPPQNFF